MKILDVVIPEWLLTRSEDRPMTDDEANEASAIALEITAAAILQEREQVAQEQAPPRERWWW